MGSLFSSDSSRSTSGSKNCTTSKSNITEKTTSPSFSKASITKEKTTVGGRTTETSDIPADLTWIEVIVNKLRSSGKYNETAEPELRRIAFILGDPESFYDHFFRTVPDDNVRRRTDFEEITRLLANHHNLNAEELNAAMLRRQQAIQDVASGKGSLEISLTFREIGQSGFLVRTMARTFTDYGAIHAAILVNNATIVEWGCGQGGASLVIPREMDLDEVGAGFVIAKHYSSFFGKVVRVLTNPVEALFELLRYLGSVIGLFQASSKELKIMSETICLWNRTKFYNVLDSNCQDFAKAICLATTGKLIKPGPLLSEYLDRVSTGDRSFQLENKSFNTAQELHDFMRSGIHDNFDLEKKFLLCMFYKLFLIRNINEPTNPDWVIRNPGTFNWLEFTESVSKNMGIHFESY